MVSLGLLDASLVVLLYLFAVLAWSLLRRSESEPVMLWVSAWAAAGVAILPVFAGEDLPLLHRFSLPFGTFSTALWLAGSLRLARRPLPDWLLPATLVLGALRVGLALGDEMRGAYLVSVPFESSALIAAAGFAHLARPHRGAGFPYNLLGPSFVVLGVARGLQLWMLGTSGVPPQLFAVWLALGPPLLGIHLLASSRLARKRLEEAYADLEHRVQERTAELATANASLEREVAERRAVEQTLRTTNDRNRQLAEISSDYGFAFRIESGGAIRDEWSSGARERITGYAPGEHDGESWISIIHPDDVASTISQFEEVRAGRGRFVELRIIRKDGAVRWLRVECRVRDDPEHDCARVVGAARDVTDLKHAESERRRLEQHAQEVQRLESLGLLAGGIAHDFNNLLGVIQGNARLASDELAVPEDAEGEAPERAGRLAERLGRIREASRFAASLTDQMLAYARRSAVAPEPVDLSELAAGTEDLLQASISEDCEIEWHLEDGLPLVEADPRQLHQVLVNLVLNASHALGSRPGRIRIRTGRMDVDEPELQGAFAADDAAPGPHAFLEVSDNGRGMDAETARRSFEPFFTTKEAGRGLGMAAVLGIVQLHHGAIRLRSMPGHGTTLRVMLPVSKQLARAAEPAARPAPGALRELPPGTTVLLVDDDEAVRELSREFLEREEFRVLSAGSGREAIEILRTQPAGVHAAVLDVAMPGLDGERTLLELRAIRPDLPAVLVTGYDREQATQRFAARGEHRLLRKPYEPEELTRSVREALAG